MTKPLRVLAIDKVAVLKNNRVRYRLLSEQADVDLTLLAPTRWFENCVMEPYQPEPGERYRTILGRPSWPGKELRSIYYNGIVRAFRQSRPEIILMMEEPFSMFGLQVVLLKRLFAPKAKVIFYTFNITSFNRYPYRPPWVYRALGDFVMRRSDVGLCITEKSASLLSESVFAGDIRPLFYPVNDQLFQRLPRDEARRRIGVPEDAFLFLYAGRLLELKGIQDLIDAFAGLRRERPELPLRLMILGDGDYGAALHAKVEDMGLGDSVEFRRAVPVEDVATYMSAATAFVLPSRAEWNEQFGRVNAEAMLIGTPLIGSTSGEIPRVVGDGGFIFQADDVADLKRVMTIVLERPEEVELRKAKGYAIAMENYSVQSFVDGLVRLFEGLSGRSLRRKKK